MTRVGRGAIVNTNLLRDTIIIVNDQQGRKRFGITFDENGNAMIEWFASDGRMLKRLSIQQECTLRACYNGARGD